MKGKRLFALMASVSLLFGTASFKQAAPLQTYKADDAIMQDATADLAIANEEKLIEMLKKSGTIPQNALPEEAEKILKDYLRGGAENDSDERKSLEERKLISEMKAKLERNGLVNGKGNKIGNVTVKPVQEQKWSGEVRKDNILVLLIDYPDYPHNSIQPSETGLYYKDYSIKHFEDMIFGTNGYDGPNGEKFISMKQFYEEQSGGSYTIGGKIAGWYRAKNPAAYYGANTSTSKNVRAKNLVYEALQAAALDPSVDLSEFDQEDRYDLDGDGNYREPDGMIDHLMVLHSGVGEEAGGGALGTNAVWSHRSKLASGPVAIPGTSNSVPYWGGKYVAWDYTIEPEDGAAGVFAHEYGHDLGLPDEYDTIYSGMGEAISYWSIMAGGSWSGRIGGTEPTGFSPYAKQFLQATMGGNWLTGTTVNYEDITSSGIYTLLDQANSKGTNNDAVRINLPQKEHVIAVPVSGKYVYFSGKGNSMNNSMSTTLDMTNEASAKLNFKAWYDIEKDWDYASVQVKTAGTDTWTSVAGNITTVTNPNKQNPGNGITGNSNGWVDAEFDLSAYAGQAVELRFNYWTDAYESYKGFYVDDIVVTADGNVILSDDAEVEGRFVFNGFEKNTGTVFANHYYLIEWRNHAGVDKGLAHIAAGKDVISFDPGMLIWYVDEYYSENWVGVHPGDGFLGVVDADQEVNYWNDARIGSLAASQRYQLHDAAFGLKRAETAFVDVSHLLGWSRTLTDRSKYYTTFDDSYKYMNDIIPDLGRKIVSYGIKIRVAGESDDRSSSKIVIYK